MACFGLKTFPHTTTIRKKIMQKHNTHARSPHAKYQQILDFIPLIAFFVAYYLQDLVFATIALIVTTLISIALHFILGWSLPKKTLIGGAFVTIFGGLTVFLGDPFYIKIKSTISFSTFAIVLLVARYGFQKSLLKLLMADFVELSQRQWLNLARDTGLFFIFLAGCNEVTRQFFSEESWVIFKTFGIPMASMFFFATSVGIRIYKAEKAEHAKPLEKQETKRAAEYLLHEENRESK